MIGTWSVEIQLFCLDIDFQYEVISLYSHSIKADSDYTLRVLLVSSIKRYRLKQNYIGLVQFCLILFDWFENQTQSKIDVRFFSVAEPNQTPIVRLDFCSILFD